MIDQKMIPREVWTTAEFNFLQHEDWPRAIAAALNAWPGASMKTTFWPNDDGAWIVPRHGWLLPLTTEARDE